MLEKEETIVRKLCSFVICSYPLRLTSPVEIFRKWKRYFFGYMRMLYFPFIYRHLIQDVFREIYENNHLIDDVYFSGIETSYLVYSFHSTFEDEINDGTKIMELNKILTPIKYSSIKVSNMCFNQDFFATFNGTKYFSIVIMVN